MSKPTNKRIEKKRKARSEKRSREHVPRVPWENIQDENIRDLMHEARDVIVNSMGQDANVVVLYQPSKPAAPGAPDFFSSLAGDPVVVANMAVAYAALVADQVGAVAVPVESTATLVR